MRAYRRVRFGDRLITAPLVMGQLRRMKRQGFDPSVILDVGAAHGNWTKSCRLLFPEANYVVVEPLPAYERELQELARDPRIDYVAAGAGRKADTLEILIPADDEGASFLPASEGSDFFRTSLRVPVIALDDLELPGSAGLVKLDVQGYEIEALAGAERILSEAEVVVCETSLYPFQNDLPLTRDVIDWLDDRGFRLYDLGDVIRWRSGTLAQLDLIFVASGSALLGERWWK